MSSCSYNDGFGTHWSYIFEGLVYIEIFQLIKHIFYHNMFVCHAILIILLAFPFPPFPLHGVEPDVKAMLRCTTLAIT